MHEIDLKFNQKILKYNTNDFFQKKTCLSLSQSFSRLPNHLSPIWPEGLHVQYLLAFDLHSGASSIHEQQLFVCSKF